MNDLMEQARWLMTAEAMWDPEAVSETPDATPALSEPTEEPFPLFI